MVQSREPAWEEDTGQWGEVTGFSALIVYGGGVIAR